MDRPAPRSSVSSFLLKDSPRDPRPSWRTATSFRDAELSSGLSVRPLLLTARLRHAVFLNSASEVFFKRPSLLPISGPVVAEMPLYIDNISFDRGSPPLFRGFV